MSGGNFRGIWFWLSLWTLCLTQFRGGLCLHQPAEASILPGSVLQQQQRRPYCAAPDRLRGGTVKASESDEARRFSPFNLLQKKKKSALAKDEQKISPNSLHSLHPYRKLFHVVAGYLFACLRNRISKQIFVEIFASLGLGGIFGETLRLNTTIFNRFFYALFGAFMREHEVNTHFSGMVFYLLGIAAAGSFDIFPAIIGIMMLTVGDPAAGITGLMGQRLLKNTKILQYLTLKNGKTLVGSVGCWAVCTLTTFHILIRATWSDARPKTMRLWILAAAVGAVTSIAELMIPSPPLVLPFKRFPLGLDDNICLPFIGAVAAHVLLRELRIPTSNSRPSEFILL